MKGEGFWAGFGIGAAAGALAGIGGVLMVRRLSSKVDNRVVRLEKSINIGSPVSAVFGAWCDLNNLPQVIRFIDCVEDLGTHSRWRINLDGRQFEWDAELTQLIPNESIGWKSVRGPKHTGRISFAPLGDQTVVHVTMNYAPPLLGSLLPLDRHLEDWIERGLREFKASLEKRQEYAVS